MLDFFESTIGPYPFGDEKMGVVETPHKGMEHQTINAYGNKYAKTAYGYDELLQHEFAHEWFGNQLTNANWDDMWLHEGLGSYMQPLYMQYLRGDQEYFASLMQQRAMIENKAPIVSGKPRLEEDVYDDKRGGPGQDIYNKGSLVMHTLRGLIGDDAFFRACARSLRHPRPAPGQLHAALRHDAGIHGHRQARERTRPGLVLPGLSVPEGPAGPAGHAQRRHAAAGVEDGKEYALPDAGRGARGRPHRQRADDGWTRQREPAGRRQLHARSAFEDPAQRSSISSGASAARAAGMLAALSTSSFSANSASTGAPILARSS
jgi:hypothetical protein